ncbi:MULTISPECIES: hypothetical protein [Rhodococcus]|uniref:hypothetical protein n=1 Tax=Rhodococcus TaxID=1827 RepID=UPI0029544CBF|nr:MULTISPECIES: hypothetical protein [Rhodococcus]MDV7244332.1 hypothetical protein [Rhodococcus oxybenzonivorans]MDV7274425.1 hypothetical protein [Rhodococcus oxybenzonivorans]MDV7335738.1 hypothetical protein [Rhodococcus oxybenzonivorans]MDV7345375.1 hypothetical protein [Rhodococcus oxybenzonivorans]MDV8029062.1 hypothetical protein [Rhodococcus sp. IEGM 27]
MDTAIAWAAVWAAAEGANPNADVGRTIPGTRPERLFELGEQHIADIAASLPDRFDDGSKFRRCRGVHAT